MFNQCQDTMDPCVDNTAPFSKEMVIDSENFLYFNLEDGLFTSTEGLPLTYRHPLSDVTVPQQPQQFQTTPVLMFQIDDLSSLQPLSNHGLSLIQQPQYDISTINLYHQQQPQPAQEHYPLCGNIAEPLTIDFSKYRNPIFERVSSPETSTSSPGSERGYFDTMSDDEYSCSPGGSSCSPVIGSFGTESDFLIKPFDQLGVSVEQDGGSSSPVAVPAVRGRKTPSYLMAPDPCSSPSYTSTSSSYTSSIPALPSPLKQQFNGYHSDGSDDSEDERQESKNKRKKRVRKVKRANTVAKPKDVKPILRCEFPECKITCSSVPSLMRHFDTHRWRGKFSPVRCEACQNSLSNEFSVQRHIMRSPVTSRCRRMRIYSIMRSATEIENTVRFYPQKGHGKKTKTVVNLEELKKKYF
ncbi:hypothetical protein BGX28_000272 [Mortierella sp. GBA30]|nr:hypothetical protein BGX28_000272 [Mortierella sp. GBA30]